MNTSYKIRMVFVFFLFCFGYFLIIGMLYMIQIKQRNFFTHLGQQQYKVTVKQLPPRGIIYDRHNTMLALNQDILSAFILPNQLDKVERVEPFLKKHFPQALARLHANPHTSFMYIKRKLSERDIYVIESSDIDDIKLLKEPSRFYPGKALSHIIGITDIDNNGLFGIELINNMHLSGSPTTYCLEKDARSGHFYFKKELMSQGSEGQSVHLTIDNDLQFLVYQELKKTVRQFNAQEGAVLVLDPMNGEILTMAQYPVINPHDFTSIEQEKTKNKIVTDAYEPGSVMKAFTALALLEEGLVSPDELIDCENNISSVINGFQFTTVKAHGIIPFAEVIQHSNNIGIAKTAVRLGPLLYDHYVKLGFGKKSSFDWPGQQAGFVNPPTRWSHSSLIALSFGYEIRATLLQLAQAFSIIANDGRLIPFTIIKNDGINMVAGSSRRFAPQDDNEGVMSSRAERGDPLIKVKSLYSPTALNTLKTILQKNNAIRMPGYTVWGKTGTANLVVDGHYSPEHNIYTFVGIIEKDEYKRLIVTFIKDAQRKDLRAAGVAVPLFDRVVQDLLLHEKMINK